MRTGLLCLIFVFATTGLFGQDTRKGLFSVYFELLGNAGWYSVNGEYLFTEHNGLRAGLSIYAAYNDRYITVPVTWSYLLGSGRSKLEAGGGILVVNRKTNINSTVGGSTFTGTLREVIPALTFILGYRYQRPQGLLFRAGLTPFIPRDASPTVWAGISVGYTF